MIWCFLRFFDTVTLLYAGGLCYWCRILTLQDGGHEFGVIICLCVFATLVVHVICTDHREFHLFIHSPFMEIAMYAKHHACLRPM